ncbi:hypothetical protein [Pseudothauera rhizosphaerae]|uniref:Uncharacterized protein n=1 Tax=Pseudothauera rhizosphaerae TaxID=2565932 RepID=A0A4S4AFQ8_9RHOO|nr:hypothetical protein [Pseudothauera rhizosphaerae]THF58044.1 hypothetical protein E6O51_17025 [Pseudothauera rhizosphaerae]
MTEPLADRIARESARGRMPATHSLILREMAERLEEAERKIAALQQPCPECARRAEWANGAEFRGTTMTTSAKEFRQYAIVELFGHASHRRPHHRADHRRMLVRVDVPEIVTKPETAVKRAKSAARGAGRSDVYALVHVGTARRDAVYREKQA